MTRPPWWFTWALLFPAVAQAYTGGPKLVDVLGWDVGAHRVYFHSIPHDESYSFGAVYHFDLAGKTPEKQRKVAWSVGDADVRDPDQQRRLRSLRSGLTPLAPSPEACLGWGVDIVHADSIDSPPGARIARYRMRLSIYDGPRFEFTGYHRPDACLKNVYVIPGRKERLYIVAFRGNAYDIAETQVAVLVPQLTDGTIQVVWEPDK
jgi:hypothetical protein